MNRRNASYVLPSNTRAHYPLVDDKLLTKAICERRIIPHPVFEQVTVGGTPDIRVILYRGAPAMAMVHLPTRASRGRAPRSAYRSRT
ncbi:MAG: hypothetical protein A2V70_20640 [Planctomycetes bacterium RBG_13_63_9]|nr:MAG: hypothetical protein A2V70_20640 [Planctomycetes bacterium RBG_13_63_9]